jgi:hypothetical protein
MRRLVAILTLCVTVLLLPAATAVLLAAPQSVLPACCRTHGVHHCILEGHLAGQGGVRFGGVQFRAPACPFSHPLHAVLILPVPATPLLLRAQPLPIMRVEQRAGPFVRLAYAPRLSRPRAPPLSFS